MFTNAEVLGRLTRDPELKQTNNGKSVVNFSLASNRPGKDDEVDFIDVTAWGKTAELIAGYKSQGDLIMVDGKLRQERWEQDGQKRSKLIVVANEVVFVSNKGENAPTADDGSDYDNEIPF